MKRARSFLLLLLGLIALLCSFTAWTVYRERRQERLNRDLIAAVEADNTKRVVSLLDQGADANCHDEPYKPLPWWQILRDRLRGVKPKPSIGDTPLQLALQWKRLSGHHRGWLWSSAPPENLLLVKTLLDHKAAVNVRDDYQNTPLHWAIMSRKKATVHLLLKYGADVRADSRIGYTPLVWATGVFSDSTDVLSDLLHRGADVNQRDQYHTALFDAVFVQNVEAVRLLLSYHADVTLWGYDGLTPLAEAKRPPVNPQKQQIIRLLQQAGAKE